MLRRTRSKKYRWLIVIGLFLVLGIQYSYSHGSQQPTNAYRPAVTQNGFLTPSLKEDPYASYASMTDEEVINTFSSTFLSFDPTKCHFTNNQGLSRRGVFHDGFDFNCLPLNTPFLVTVRLPLRIIETGWDDLYGNHIIARDLTNRFTFIFGHLSEVYVHEGEISSIETPLFKTGTTGNSSGVHLHFEILKNGFPTQLSDAVYERFPTIYKKAEKDPSVVLASVLHITPEEVQSDYIKYVDNTFYPLNWYKIIALALYEHISFLGEINSMMDHAHINDYYQFATYFDHVKNMTDRKKHIQELANIRTLLYAFERAQFAIDVQKEKICEAAEQAFRDINPIDYPQKKKK